MIEPPPLLIGEMSSKKLRPPNTVFVLLLSLVSLRGVVVWLKRNASAFLTNFNNFFFN